jgi:AraC-like DNA-binding protein
MVPKLPLGYRQIVKRSCTISDFVLTDTVYSASSHLSDYVHERVTCGLVLEGSFDEYNHGQTWLCKSPCIVFRLPRDVHATRFHDGGAHCLNVEIHPSLVERIAECGKLPEQSFVSYDPLLSGLAVKLYKEFVDMDDFSRITIEGLMLEIVAGLLRDHSTEAAKRPLWLERARQMIQYEFSARPSVSDLARKVGVHPVHLAREFQRYYQRSIGEYVRELRVHLACRQLSNSDQPIFEIAVESGFSDHSHFCRTFKKLLGLTPAEYRALFRS